MEVFNQIDKNSDNVLSLAEIREYAENISLAHTAEMKTKFLKLTGGDEDFKLEHALNKTDINAAEFRVVDLNQDDAISFPEMVAFIIKKEVDTLLIWFDADKDNNISHQEYVELEA